MSVDADEQESNEQESNDADEQELPPLDFKLMVFSLNASALEHLGESAEPTGVPAMVDLALARQIIDMLAVLELKTRGNLTGEEERLLNQVLIDLRLRFTRKASPVPR
jgi:hypothetical protein